jgi:tRNA-specific 2-thiouridylase
MSRVVLAMSGGVDSSVAAHLLRRAGHDVVGLFMRHGEQAETACATESKPAGGLFPILPAKPGHKQGCCSASDADDARRVADRLDVPFYALDFSDDFGRIQDYFVEEYVSGRTPNPCVVCNNWLKFGKLLEYADGVGAEFVATGHYARLARLDGPTATPALLRGVDDGKDQSYVLFGIERDVLPRMLLPVGDYKKDAIRELAREIGLRVADKRDSQEICFVPDNDYAAFVRRRVGELKSAGEVVLTDGTVVGRHEGIEHFTIGQRKGLGIALGEPRYVVRIEADEKRVVLGTADELLRDELTASRTNWLVEEPTEPRRCSVKIRYLAKPVAATVTPLADRRLHVRFDEPRGGVAPGQAVVCYDTDRVLGGGWID